MDTQQQAALGKAANTQKLQALRSVSVDENGIEMVADGDVLEVGPMTDENYSGDVHVTQSQTHNEARRLKTTTGNVTQSRDGEESRSESGDSELMYADGHPDDDLETPGTTGRNVDNVTPRLKSETVAEGGTRRLNVF